MKSNYLNKTVFVGILSLFLFACGDNGQEDAGGQSDSVEEPTEPAETPDPDDNGENDDDESDDVTEEDQNDTLADMSEEERHEHYRSLMRNPEELDEAVFEYLELRGLHENTVIYGGRVNPGSTVHVFGDSGHASSVTVNEEGFFSIDLPDYIYSEREELPFVIEHDDLETSQAFVLPFHPAEEGMEVIEPLSDVSEWQEQLSAEINEFPEVYPNVLYYEQAAGREIDALYFAIEGEEMTNGHFDGLEEPNTDGEYTIQFLRYPEVGETITYYVVADGTFFAVERKVQEMTSEVEQASEYIQNETEIVLQPGAEEETFQTIPNAKVVTTFSYDFLREETYSDESGAFTFSLPSRGEDLESGDSVYFTIENEDGYSETIEVTAE